MFEFNMVIALIQDHYYLNPFLNYLHVIKRNNKTGLVYMLIKSNQMATLEQQRI